LTRITGVSDLLGAWQDGRIKQALISQVLNLRARHSALFSRGQYVPLEVLGAHAEQVLAFARINDAEQAIVVVPRLCNELLGTAQTPFINAANWGDTRVVLPFADANRSWKGLFSDAVVTTDKELLLSAALKEFSVNLFIQTK
jgi:(1->4)-alpha-D-glucan 1-alpha-D-glucosylmutase